MEEKNKAWKTVSSKYLFRRPWLTVRCEDMLLPNGNHIPEYYILEYPDWVNTCLLYTSDAADDMQSVDLGGSRIIKK